MKKPIFKFDFNKLIKQGYYSAIYFKKTKKIIDQFIDDSQIATLQFTFFNNKDVKVCGISESVQLLKAMISKEDFKKIKIYGVNDGDIVNSSTPILVIQGPYKLFAIYENLIDGILARRTSVCNNCYKLLKVLKQNEVLYMADRTDDYIVQPYDGYAAYVGGIRNFVTEASVKYLKQFNDITVSGTVPHALIQQFNGNLSQALKAYHKTFPQDKLVALIDYNNDVENEIINLKKSGIRDLDFIRIDTSANLVDFSIQRRYKNWKNNKNLYGVNPTLVNIVRKTLDKCGFNKTKIIISSGLDTQKVKVFIKNHSPVDLYGIGSSLITRNIHYCADLVMINKHHQAKYGRKLFIPINKLKKIN